MSGCEAAERNTYGVAKGKLYIYTCSAFLRGNLHYLSASPVFISSSLSLSILHLHSKVRHLPHACLSSPSIPSLVPYFLYFVQMFVSKWSCRWRGVTFQYDLCLGMHHALSSTHGPVVLGIHQCCSSCFSHSGLSV